MWAMLQVTDFSAKTMSKKRLHNHCFYQTNPKNNPKTKTILKKNNQKKCFFTQNSHNNNQKNPIIAAR
jgi:hypothetical protein